MTSMTLSPSSLVENLNVDETKVYDLGGCAGSRYGKQRLLEACHGDRGGDFTVYLEANHFLDADDEDATGEVTFTVGDSAGGEVEHDNAVDAVRFYVALLHDVAENVRIDVEELARAYGEQARDEAKDEAAWDDVTLDAHTLDDIEARGREEGARAAYAEVAFWNSQADQVEQML